MHNCHIIKQRIELDSYPETFYGDAINKCLETPDGAFYVDNCEYVSQVNFCPFCGQKATLQLQFEELS